MDFILLAEKIVNNMGGRENISYFSRCMSRLRFSFADIGKVNFDELKKVREITGVVRCQEEVYIVIRKSLDGIYNEIRKRLGNNYSTSENGGVYKYVKYYKGIIITAAILYLGEILINVEAEYKFSFVVFITMILSFITGVTADVLLNLIKNEDNRKDEKEIEIIAPVKGKVIKHSDNYIISQSTVLVYPDLNVVFSPVDGWVEEIYRTKHAILIRSDIGFGVLIHIGVDTVSISEECFNSFVETGDYVSKGEVILEFDADRILENGYDLTTAIDVVECNEGLEVEVCTNYATEGRCLIRLLDTGRL